MAEVKLSRSPRAALFDAQVSTAQALAVTTVRAEAKVATPYDKE
jgi:hypothetical protein